MGASSARDVSLTRNLMDLYAIKVNFQEYWIKAIEILQC